MRFFPLLAISGWLLSFPLSSHAASCAIAAYDEQSSAVTLPCVQAGEQTLQMRLELVKDTDWLVQPSDVPTWQLMSSNITSCTPVIGQCAILDNQQQLMFPIQLANGTKFHATLKSTNSNFSSAWQLKDVQQINQSDALVLTKGSANPEGSFSELFVFHGNFANPKAFKDLQIAEGVTPPTKSFAVGTEKKLRIFHFNDFHSNLRATSASRGDTHYFSQMVKKVKEAKQQTVAGESILFVSAGDDHTGNALDELLGTSPENFVASAPYSAYSAAGLDVAVIGNHDLDRGTALLAKAISNNAKFPILSANLFGSKYLTANHYSPAMIGVTKEGLRVGIVGVTTKVSSRLGTTDDPTSNASDMSETVALMIPYLEPFSDVIIILSHVGYNGKVDGAVRHIIEEGDVEIAKAAAAVTQKPTLLIGGHTHTVLNEKGLTTVVSSIPVFQAGSYGSHLGEINLTLKQTNAGLLSYLTAQLHTLKKRDQRTATTSAANYNPANYEQDSDIDLSFENTVIQPLYTLLKAKLSEVLGTVGSFSELTTENTINKRYLGQTAIHNFMNDAILERSKTFPVRPDGTNAVDIAVFNASGVSSGVTPSSTLTFNDWFNVMPYADLIEVINMSGQQIKDMLESNAQRILRSSELESNGGTIKAADLSAFAYSYGFLHFSKSLKYTIKLNDAPRNATVQNITINGQPLENMLNKTFRVAFGDYIALRGGENWKGQTTELGRPAKGFDLTALPRDETGLVYRNEIIEFIRTVGKVDESTGAAIDDRLTIIP